MTLQGNNINLLKQLPFYEEFTNAKLLPFFEKPIKAKIKQLTTKKLLQEQPFYKQPIKNPVLQSWKTELLCELPFYNDINISRKERVFRKYAETYKVEVINNRNLSDLLFMSKSSIRNLFDDLLREKGGFKYNLSTKISLK